MKQLIAIIMRSFWLIIDSNYTFYCPLVADEEIKSQCNSVGEGGESQAYQAIYSY